MTGEKWTFDRSDELVAAIDALDPVLRHKVNKDIQKVVTRGIDRVGEPLVAHFEGDIYYVRSMVKGCGWFRTFYFRSGRFSLYGFFGYFKKGAKLPRRIRKQVLAKYEDYQRRVGG